MGHEKVDAALIANKAHQAALVAYVEHLQRELENVDSLLAIADAEDDTGGSSESENEDNIRINVPGAVKPTSLLLPRELLEEGGPFASDARWKRNYEEVTNHNPMKSREHEVLREAVRIENRRLQALGSNIGFTQVAEELTAHPPEFYEQNTVGLDFRRIALTVNDMIPSGVKRTALECEIRWRGYLHPSFSHTTWSPAEITQLHHLVADAKKTASPPNWVEIAKKLNTGRTPIDCVRRAVTRRQHTWSKAADNALLEAVEVYGLNNWQLVAMHVSEDATAHQCQKRYADTLDTSVRGGPWTAEEDERLLRAIAAFSPDGSKSRASPDIDSNSQHDTESVQGPSNDHLNAGAETGAKEKGKRNAKADKGKYRERIQVPWQDVALFVPGRTNNQCRERYERVLMRGGELSKPRTGGRRRGESSKVVKATVANARKGGNTESQKFSRTQRSTPPATMHHNSDVDLDDRQGNTSLSATPQPEDTGNSMDGQSRKDMFIPSAPQEAQAVRKRPQPRPRLRRKGTMANSGDRPNLPEQALSSSQMSPQTSAPASATSVSPGTTPQQAVPGPPVPNTSQTKNQAHLPHTNSRKRKRTYSTGSSSDDDGDETIKISTSSTPMCNTVANTANSTSRVRRSSRIAGAAGRL